MRKYIQKIPKDVDDRKEAVKQAIIDAIDQCILDGVLSNFLSKHREVVEEASMWDYNEELHLKNVKQEGYDNGFEDGYDNGFENGINSGESKSKISIYHTMLSNGYSKEEAMKLTGVTDELLLNNETTMKS